MKALVNAKLIKANEDELNTGKLLKTADGNVIELEQVKNDILANKSYENFYFSKDKKLLLLLLQSNFSENKKASEDNLFEEFSNMEANPTKSASVVVDIQDIEKKNAEYISSVLNVVSKYKELGHKIYVGGQPRVLDAYYQSTQKNLAKLTIITILVIAIALIVLFKRLRPYDSLSSGVVRYSFFFCSYGYFRCKK